MAKISEMEKSEMIKNIFNEMDIENMDKQQIFMIGVGVGRKFEKDSPAPEPYVD
jgi:hypothetical protein